MIEFASPDRAFKVLKRFYELRSEKMDEWEKKVFSDCKEKFLRSSGKAFKKFKEIIETQEGTLDDVEEKLKLARFSCPVKAKNSGIIKKINNKKMAYVARISGCPADKRAGIFLYHHLGDKIKKGETLFTLYAETKDKLDYARSLSERIIPIIVK